MSAGRLQVGDTEITITHQSEQNTTDLTMSFGFSVPARASVLVGYAGEVAVPPNDWRRVSLGLDGQVVRWHNIERGGAALLSNMVGTTIMGSRTISPGNHALSVTTNLRTLGGIPQLGGVLFALVTYK